MYWKEATAAFKKHQESRYHYEAVEALLVLPKQVSDIEEVLDKQLKILQSVRFLVRRGLPLRHNIVEAQEEIDSNFMQLLLLQSSDPSEIVTWLKKKTDKYISHDIQNE